MEVSFNNTRSRRIFVLGIFEDLARIEEICNSLSFYLSKMYDMEPLFGRSSKYAVIAKQAVFLAIQRSNSLATDIMRRVDTAEQNEILAVSNMKEPFSELDKMVKMLERDYNHRRFHGILDRLRKTGEKASMLKEEFLGIL